MTLADDLRENGWRHITRGLAHRAAGREDWAHGSFVKAQRNFQGARELDINDPRLRAVTDTVADRIAANMMKLMGEP